MLFKYPGSLTAYGTWAIVAFCKFNYPNIRTLIISLISKLNLITLMKITIFQHILGMNY
jgi:hypothetical protein